MKNRLDKPDIFSYRKPQVYLADLIQWYKTKKISLRNLSKKLNVSPALLSLISSGKRQLTEENVEAWANFFEWNAQEVTWLKKIIALEFATTSEKRDALEGMTRFKSFKEKSSQEVLTYKYLQKWWNVAIREMSDLPDFQEDPDWIQKRLLYKVSIENVRKSLTFLNKNRLLSKYGNFRRLDCQGDVYKLALSSFHEQILNKAVESIYKVSSDKRHILGQTVTISEDQLPELKDILDETLEKIIKLTEKSSGVKEVYHMALIGFPLTEDK
jgi:uncharacterized protein (TIGR02147 family)